MVEDESQLATFQETIVATSSPHDASPSGPNSGPTASLSPLDSPTPALVGPSLGRRLFLGFLLVVAGFYTVVLGYHLATPRTIVRTGPMWLERCRELCLSYGLVPSGHVANDALAYLDHAEGAARPPQVAELDQAAVPLTPSQPHPLLGRPAPDFRLPDDQGNVMMLSEQLRSGPVVLVFYYGYSCSHCVAQLFALQRDLDKFQQAGARIVAISADPSERTAARFAEYGRFDFATLSDRDNAVATQYGVFIPATPLQDEDRLHGTFLINGDGTVQFAQRGYQPFLENATLLSWLAGHRPDPAVSRQKASAGDAP